MNCAEKRLVILLSFCNITYTSTQNICITFRLIWEK